MYKRHIELPVNHEGKITATYISSHYKEGSGGGRRVGGGGIWRVRQTDRQTEKKKEEEEEEENLKILYMYS